MQTVFLVVYILKMLCQLVADLAELHLNLKLLKIHICITNGNIQANSTWLTRYFSFLCRFFCITRKSPGIVFAIFYQ